MRNRTFGDYWFLFILLFVFGGSGLLPFAIIMGSIFAVIYAAVKAANNSVGTSSSYRRRTNSYGYTERRTGNSHTAADLAKINVYLRKYFRTNTHLEMPNGIELFLRTENYSNLSNLDVYRNGTRIGTLNEFRNRYKELYDSLFETLLAMAKNAQKAGEVEIVDAEIEEKKPERKETKKETKKKEEKQEPAKKTARYFMEGINSLNSDIPDEEISNGLYETSALLKQIDMLENKFPDSGKKMQKMYDYYLPYLAKILQQYTNLQMVKSDANYEKNVEQLKGTIHSINEALNTIIPSMSDSDFTNLSADMATLEALLRKDGLTGGIDMVETAKKDGE